MGPWSIRDDANPFRPGCSFGTLRGLIARGKIGPETVIRGPSTRQFWELARRTPGVASLLGLCHSCQEAVSPSDFSCQACGAAFNAEHDRQHLGVGPVRLLPGQASPERVAASSMPSHAVVTNGDATAGSSPAESTESAPPAAAPSRSLRSILLFALVGGTLAIGATGAVVWRSVGDTSTNRVANPPELAGNLDNMAPGSELRNFVQSEPQNSLDQGESSTETDPGESPQVTEQKLVTSDPEPLNPNWNTLDQLRTLR